MKGTRKDGALRSRRLRMLVAGAGAALAVAIVASSANAAGGYHPPDGLVRHRKFKIRNAAPENEYIGLLAGEFNKKRTKIMGVLRYRGISSDPSLGVCDTGKVEWTARRTP